MTRRLYPDYHADKEERSYLDCNAYSGPCACGAWHLPSDWPRSVRMKQLAYEGKQSRDQQRALRHLHQIPGRERC